MSHSPLIAVGGYAKGWASVAHLGLDEVPVFDSM